MSSSTKQENRFVSEQIAPVASALRREANLRRAFAVYCVELGADPLTIGTRIRHLVEGRAPVKAFIPVAALAFGRDPGLKLIESGTKRGLKQEKRFVAQQIAAVVAALRANSDLRRAFAVYCIKLGGDPLTIGTRIRLLVEGMNPVKAFIPVAALAFGPGERVRPKQSKKNAGPAVNARPGKRAKRLERPAS